mmetsp:Transcript_84713/g.262299  ORF Transcript_84713/g.262299 Transcript_84713/m.262299 type:complete len:214 (-) Transcript_84713:151-792(-)
MRLGRKPARICESQISCATAMLPARAADSISLPKVLGLGCTPMLTMWSYQWRPRQWSPALAQALMTVLIRTRQRPSDCTATSAVMRSNTASAFITSPAVACWFSSQRPGMLRRPRIVPTPWDARRSSLDAPGGALCSRGLAPHVNRPRPADALLRPGSMEPRASSPAEAARPAASVVAAAAEPAPGARAWRAVSAQGARNLGKIPRTASARRR